MSALGPSAVPWLGAPRKSARQVDDTDRSREENAYQDSVFSMLRRTQSTSFAFSGRIVAHNRNRTTV